MQPVTVFVFFGVSCFLWEDPIWLIIPPAATKKNTVGLSCVLNAPQKKEAHE